MPRSRLADRLIDRIAGVLADRVAERLQAEAAPSRGARTAPADSRGGDALGQSIRVDYAVKPRPRWGETWGLPAHELLTRIIRSDDDFVAGNLAILPRYRQSLQAIPEDRADASGPHWVNGWLPGWDGAAIYAYLADRRPATYLEVGSGNSTKFARRAIADQDLATRVVSVDPCPRAEVNDLCDTVIREPLEDVDLALLSQLTSGDIVFIDNSHRVFQNSDVTVAFLELLPRLPPGVLIGFHDIFLPNDYPSHWADRYYSEQYLLAAFLLGGHANTRIFLPAFDASKRPAMSRVVNAIWEHPHLQRVERHGGAFWLETCGASG